MRIHGHSIIELRNVKTGEVERYEDDNMVTNGVAKYIEDMGMFNTSPLLVSYEVISNPIVRMMGGLLLLDTALDDTSADNITVPCGVGMIGNGAYNKTYGDADTRDVKELGSWNSTESIWQSDGSFRMVWDFPTTQANGSIACACLTSDHHGWAGEGNTGGVTVGISKRDNEYANTGTATDYFVGSDYRDLRLLVHGSRTNSALTFIDKANIIYDATKADEHMGATGKIKLKTFKVPLSKFDLRESFPYNTNGGNTYMPIAETEINVPGGFVAAINGKTPLHYIRHGKYYYIITDGSGSGWRDNYTMPSGVSTLHVLRINPDNTVKYTTATLPNDYNYIDIKNTVFSTSDRIAMPVFSNSGAYLWVQDMSNQADEKMVAITYPRPDLTPGFGINRPEDRTGTINMGGYSWKVNIDEQNPLKILYPLNMVEAGKIVSILDDNPLAVFVEGSDGVLTKIHKSQGYLATINNLQEPIMKTADKTMKVTYIIGFDDGE